MTIRYDGKDATLSFVGPRKDDDGEIQALEANIDECKSWGIVGRDDEEPRSSAG